MAAETGSGDQSGGLFSTTKWSLVLAAGDTVAPSSREALAALCRLYWYPVYALIRHLGNDRDSSKDLAQGFFAYLLENQTLKIADPERGSFRSFLKAVLYNYLRHERRREQAQKRGGGRPRLDLDFEGAEARYRSELSHDETPDKLFEKRWAQTLLTRAFERLGNETADESDHQRFRVLAPFLTEGSQGRSYADVAVELAMTEGAVKATVHRMRKRYGQLLRAEVAQTLADPDQVEKEIRYLFSIVTA